MGAFCRFEKSRKTYIGILRLLVAGGRGRVVRSRGGLVHNGGGSWLVHYRGGLVHNWGRGGLVYNGGGLVHNRGGSVHNRSGLVHHRGGSVWSRGRSGGWWWWGRSRGGVAAAATVTLIAGSAAGSLQASEKSGSLGSLQVSPSKDGHIVAGLAELEQDWEVAISGGDGG